MKVLQVNIDDLNYGGVYALIKDVVIRKPSSLQVDIFSIEGFQIEDNIKLFENYGCRIVELGNQTNKFIKQFKVFYKLFKYIKNNKYDAIHIHADTANKLAISGLAAKLAGSHSIIMHAHASGVEGNHRLLKSVIHHMCRPFLPLIGNKFVVCSDKARRWMFPTVGNVVTINNGIDLSKYRFDKITRHRIRRDLNITDAQLLIGHVGRFCYPKNHSFMIKIAKELKTNNLNYRMIFVGDGDTKKDIEIMAKSEGLENEIVFYGTSDRVQDLLQAMDIFLLPSKYEGFPIAGVEAQASGLPVIFSDRLTKDVRLTNNVVFLGIEDSCVKDWYLKIVDFSKVERVDTYDDMVKSRFDISDTINSFIDLYKYDREGY